MISMNISPPLYSLILRVILTLILLSGLIMVFANDKSLDSAMVDAWVKNAGMAGPILFIVVYAFGTVLLVPGPLFLLVAGVLYGPLHGTFYCLTGTMIGSSIAFLIARFIASDWLEAKIDGRLKWLKEGVEQEGWRFVAFLRLVPVFPSVLINYALGLTRIKFSHFFFTSYICKIPTVSAYVYVGHAGLEAISGADDLVPTVLTGLALIGLVFFLPRLIIILRRGPSINIKELKSKLHSGEKMLLLHILKSGEDVSEYVHVAGEVDIFLDDLEQRLDELTDYIEHPVALISSTERISSKAAKILLSNGFAHVRIVIE